MADDFDGFIFNVERWFGSVTQQRMSFAEKGVYLVMMFQQWRERTRSLPDDPQAVAELIAVTPGQVEEVCAAWPVVRRKFVASRHTSGQIYNVEIENTRRRQRAARRKVSDAGRAGGKASAAKRRGIGDLPLNDRSTTVERPSTEVSCSEVLCSEVERKDLSVAPGASGNSNGTGLQERFDAFWAQYPKKVGKLAAYRAWQKLKPASDLLGTMLAVLAWQKQQDQWVRERGRFVPNPSTWLNQGRWQDEPVTTPQVAEGTLRAARAVEEFLK